MHRYVSIISFFLVLLIICGSVSKAYAEKNKFVTNNEHVFKFKVFNGYLYIPSYYYLDIEEYAKNNRLLFSSYDKDNLPRDIIGYIEIGNYKKYKKEIKSGANDGNVKSYSCYGFKQEILKWHTKDRNYYHILFHNDKIYISIVDADNNLWKKMLVWFMNKYNDKNGKCTSMK